MALQERPPQDCKRQGVCARVRVGVCPHVSRAATTPNPNRMRADIMSVRRGVEWGRCLSVCV